MLVPPGASTGQDTSRLSLQGLSSSIWFGKLIACWLNRSHATGGAAGPHPPAHLPAWNLPTTAAAFSIHVGESRSRATTSQHGRCGG